MYDYLVVGSGLFGAIFAYEASKVGKKVLVVEKRSHIGGNCFTERIEEINVHKYGAHIFRTSRKDIWEYIQQFSEFNNFINSPIANYNGEIYNLPFNMNTFSKLWGISTPDEARSIIEKQGTEIKKEPANLEEHVIKMVGRDVYEKLVKEYTEKQWGRPCKELPATIIRRLPVRYTYDNNYFNDKYQGIPINGYTPIFEKLLTNCEVKLNTNFLDNKQDWLDKASRIVFTGNIDSYFDYCEGELEYRSLKFEHEIIDSENFQGVAVVNYTDKNTPYTRIIEHKHFEFGKQKKTIISREYPCEWSRNIEPYYPINNKRNQEKYDKYKDLSKREEKVIFGGRLGEYKYYDMQDTIISALNLAKIMLYNR